MAKLKTGRHTGAIKANRQSERKAQHNRGIRKQLKTVVKDFLTAAAAKDSSKTGTTLSKTVSSLDKAAKKGTIHWKTAARKKSRLAKKANSLAK